MRSHPDLSPADRADIVDRVFEQKVHDFVEALKEGTIFGSAAGGMSLLHIALLNKTYKAIVDKIMKKENFTVMYICMTNLRFLYISLPMQFYTR